MTKLMKKSLLIITMLMMVLAATTFPSSAASVEKTAKNNFKKAWKKTTYDTGSSRIYNLEMEYGYNTIAINEDYTHGSATAGDKVDGKYHKSSVKNSRGTFKSKGVAYCYVSVIEVRHKGSSVTYKVWNYKK